MSGAGVITFSAALSALPFGTALLAVVSNEEPEFNAVDLPTVNPDMAALRDALPEGIETDYRDTADALAVHALAAVQPGDVLVVKSSKGTGFSRIVAALLDKYPVFSEREHES